MRLWTPVQRLRNTGAAFLLSTVCTRHTHYCYSVQSERRECSGILIFCCRPFLLQNKITHALLSEIKECSNFLLQIFNTRVTSFTQCCDLEGAARLGVIPYNDLMCVVLHRVVRYIISVTQKTQHQCGVPLRIRERRWDSGK